MSDDKENITKFLAATFVYLKTISNTELPACILKHLMRYVANVETFNRCYNMGCNNCPNRNEKGQMEMKQVDIKEVVKEAVKEIATIAQIPHNKKLLTEIISEEKQLHPELKEKYEELENLLKIKSKAKEGFDIPVN